MSLSSLQAKSLMPIEFINSLLINRPKLSWFIANWLFIFSMMLASSILIINNAQAASCKVPKSYYKNVACTPSKGYFLATKDFGAPVALIDSKGKMVVDLLRYQQVEANKIASGLIPVQRNSKVGYLDMRGREVVPIIYDRLNESSGWARAVAEDRIIVKKAGSYGVISTTNKTIVPFSSTFDNIDNYSNGRARITKGKTVSWLDKNGNSTADPKAKSSGDAKQQTNASSANKDLPLTAKAGDPKPQSSATFTTLRAQKRDGKWGFVDDNNTTMITYSFDEVRPFSEGLAAVKIDNEWGFVNLGGELVIPLRFAEQEVPSSGIYKRVGPLIFVEGKAWIGSLDNGDKRCIDTQGANVSCD